MPDSTLSTGASPIRQSEVVSGATFNVERKLAGAILLLLLGGCILILLPFLPAFLWALVLCVALWPGYARLLRLFGQRRTLAALVTTGRFDPCLAPAGPSRNRQAGRWRE